MFITDQMFSHLESEYVFGDTDTLNKRIFFIIIW